MKGNGPSARTPVGSADRAQSVFDYSIGVSLFIVVVLGVLVFVPTAFGTLTDGAGSDGGDSLAAERAAEYLTRTGFTDNGTASTLTAECTTAFFEDADACGFTSGNLSSDAGLGANQPLNVTIEANATGNVGRERLGWNATTGALERSGVCGDDCVSLTAGSSAVANGDYVVATRSGRLDGDVVTVVVRRW